MRNIITTIIIRWPRVHIFFIEQVTNTYAEKGFFLKYLDLFCGKRQIHE